MNAQNSFTKRIDFVAQSNSFNLNLKLIRKSQHMGNDTEYLYFNNYLHNNY